jgi:Na+/proline symporter
MDIDLSIVVLYLVVTLGFGIWSGRGVRTIREFAVDNGGMSTWALYATIFATYIGGGSTIGMTSLGGTIFGSDIGQKRKISKFPHCKTHHKGIF